MLPIKELADDIYREKVQRAREMSLGEKFLLGADLFDMAGDWTLAGIRSQNPAFTEEQIDAEFQRRLALSRRLDDIHISIEHE